MIVEVYSDGMGAAEDERSEAAAEPGPPVCWRMGSPSAERPDLYHMESSVMKNRAHQPIDDLRSSAV